MSTAQKSGGVADGESAGKHLPAAIIPLALTYLATAMNLTITTVALPTISVTMGVSNSELAWIAYATPITSASLILLAGGLGDRFGRRRVLQAGIIVFLVTALLSSIAGNPQQLILLRALTGVGSALAMPAAMALTFDVTTTRNRQTGVGIMSATQAMGSLLGPLLGGLALVLFWWGAAFLVVTPFLIFSLIVNMRLLPAGNSGSEERPAIDVTGALVTAVAAVAILLTVSGISSPTAKDSLIWLAAAIAVVAIAVLVVLERRSDHPMFDVHIIRRRTFWVPTLAIVVVNLILGGLLFLTTQYVQLVLDFSALVSGAFLLPALVTWTAVSVASGVLARRFGPVTVLAAGLLAGAAGLLLVGRAGEDPNPLVLILGLAISGSIGIAPALLTNLAVSNYPQARRTVGSAINSMAYRMGLSFGIALFGSVSAVVFSRSMEGTANMVPDKYADTVQSSLGAAHQVADRLTADLGETVEASSHVAFLNGYSLSMTVAAVLLVGLAALAVATLHGRIDMADVTGKNDTSMA